MLEVMRAQFTRKGFGHGKAGVAALAAGSPLVQVRTLAAPSSKDILPPSWLLPAPLRGQCILQGRRCCMS